MIEGSGIKRDLKLAGLGHEILLLQLTTIPRLPAITTLHWESCLSFAVRMPVRVFSGRSLNTPIPPAPCNHSLDPPLDLKSFSRLLIF